MIPECRRRQKNEITSTVTACPLCPGTALVTRMCTKHCEQIRARHACRSTAQLRPR